MTVTTFERHAAAVHVLGAVHTTKSRQWNGKECTALQHRRMNFTGLEAPWLERPHFHRHALEVVAGRQRWAVEGCAGARGTAEQVSVLQYIRHRVLKNTSTAQGAEVIVRYSPKSINQSINQC